MNKLVQVVDTARIPYFVCIGTELSYVDGISPRIGSSINKVYRVLGTLGDNIDNTNLKDRYEEIKNIDSAVYQVIALDCAFDHEYCGTEKLVVYENGLKPASYLGSKNNIVGEIGVGINVSPFVNSIYEFLTGEKRQDILRVEKNIKSYLLRIKERYPLAMRFAMLKDLGYEDKIIKRKLKLSDEELLECASRLKNINYSIYERMILNEKH